MGKDIKHTFFIGVGVFSLVFLVFCSMAFFEVQIIKLKQKNKIEIMEVKNKNRIKLIKEITSSGESIIKLFK